jgi:hypothetical protein
MASVEEMGSVDREFGGESRGRLALHEPPQDQEDRGAGIPNALEDRVGEHVVDAPARAAAILDDGCTIARVRRLHVGSFVPVRTVQPVGVQVLDQPPVATVLVKQFPDRKAERRAHERPPP